jgi:hypothetical protein
MACIGFIWHRIGTRAGCCEQVDELWVPEKVGNFFTASQGHFSKAHWQCNILVQYLEDELRTFMVISL